MGEVIFEPYPDTPRRDGWPIKLLGDGFIQIELRDVEYAKGEYEPAIYEDAFGDRYEVYGRDNPDWVIDVRED